MPTFIQSLAKTGSSLIAPWSTTLGGKGSGVSAPPRDGGFHKAPRERDLFPAVDPAVDGEECLHDCESCTIRYPGKFKIDEGMELYGWVKGWATHLLVATGKTDWVRDVEDEKGSVMEGIGKAKVKPENGRMMLSASNIPLPHDELDPYRNPTRVLLLPAFIWVENVTHNNVDQLITHIVNAAPTTTTPFEAPLASATRTTSNGSTALSSESYKDSTAALSNGDDTSAPITATLSNGHVSSHSKDPSTLSIPSSLPFTTKPVGHSALILLCSQGTRDARCGQSAPLLRREFERHLRPHGLYRDLYDERPGGVGIYFISHTGGHKFSANVIVYRRKSMDRWTTKLHGSTNTTVKPDAEAEDDDSWGAAQCIWLARVKPNECEGIVNYTVLQGKVVKPEWQLRGGFDRCRKLVSW